MPVLPIIRLLGARVRTRDAFVLVEHLHLTVVHTILLHRSNFLRGRTGFFSSSLCWGELRSFCLLARAREYSFFHRIDSTHATTSFTTHATTVFFDPVRLFFFFRFLAFTTVLWRITGGKIPRERKDGTIELDVGFVFSFSFSFLFFFRGRKSFIER